MTSQGREKKKNYTQLSEAFSAFGRIPMKDYSNRVHNFQHWFSFIYFIVQTCLAGWTGKCGERPRSVNDEGWLHLRIPQKRSNPVLIAPLWPIAVKQQGVSCVSSYHLMLLLRTCLQIKILILTNSARLQQGNKYSNTLICFVFSWFYFNFKLCKELLGQLSIKIKYRHIYSAALYIYGCIIYANLGWACNIG